MCENIDQKINNLTIDIEKLKKTMSNEDCALFKNCQLKLQNNVNELFEKRIDRIRNYLILFIGIISFLGIKQLNDFIKETTEKNVKAQIEEQKTITRENIEKLNFSIQKSVSIADNYHKILLERFDDMLLMLIKSGGRDNHINHEAIRKFLLIPKINVDVSDNEKRCAILWAVLRSDIKTVSMLLENNAKIDCTSEPEDGHTPLFKALHAEELGIAEILIEKGANLYATDRQNETPFSYAIKNHYYNLVLLMLNKNANVDFKLTNNENNALILAIENDCSPNIVHHIIAKTSNINYTNINDETALIVAAQKDNKAIAKLLIKEGADRIKAFEWARKMDKMEIIRFLENLN